nr:hypothetical protein [Tanacetum cinerariifolium]
PKIDEKDHSELKGQFLKELRDNTFSSSDHEHMNEHIEKVLKFVDLFHVPNITQDQVILRVFPMSLTGAVSRWLRNKLTRSNETSDGLTAIQAQLNNLGREMKKVNEKVYVAQVGCEQCKAPYYTKYCPLKEEGKTLEEAYYTQFGSLPRSTKTNSRDHVKSISITVEADMIPIRCIRSSQYAVSAQQNSKIMFELRQMTISFPSHLHDYYCDWNKGSYGLQCLDTHFFGATRVDDSLPRKEKDLGSFTLPCYINNVCFENSLADLGASVSVMPISTYLNLGLGELAHTKLTVELIDITVQHPKGIAKNVLVGIELRRDQFDDLMPIIEEGEVFNEPMIDIIKTRIAKVALLFHEVWGVNLPCRIAGEGDREG